MSDRESANSTSNTTSDGEKSDKSTGRPKEWQDQDPENKHDDCPDNREGRDPNATRVHWRANTESMRDIARTPPREDLRTEWDKAQKEGEPHPSTMPYEHESVDIADEPRQPQQDWSASQKTEDIGPDEKAPPEKPSEYDPERKNIPATMTPSSVRERLRSFSSNWSRRASELATRLGRPEYTGDDLTSGVYHGDSATGNAVPESDFTDDKHKTDDQKHEDKANSSSEAHRLVRDLTQDHSSPRRRVRGRPYGAGAGKNYVGGPHELAIDSGLRYRSGGGGVLSQLMKLQGQEIKQQEGSKPRTSSESSESSQTSSASGASVSSSGSGLTGKKAKPVKWYKRPPNTSTSTLIGGAASLSGASTPISDEVISAAQRRQGKQPNRNVKLEDEIRVTVHIAEIICRQRYIMQLCRALMSFGAPTHRLEEYMQMTAKVLEVDAQFLYLPGCMIMAFDDTSTRTTEFKLVRVAQGVDLARLSDSHLIYKNVIHDVIGIEEAVQELEEVVNSKPHYPKWLVVLVYGLATATVGPFAFNARPIDMPIIFLNGLCVGAMQHLAAPRSVLYSNVFEVTSTVVTSFIARAFGSIKITLADGKKQYLFCFSAIAQSSIALILPGFLVLCSSLELQSHQIIAGSIRMVYAIIFSLFIGYGITVGTTVYGLIDRNAVSDIQCPQEGAFKSPYVQHFPFVFVMTFWLLIINQGKWKQLPPMTFIAMCGYISNYFSTLRLGSNSQVANTVGAFCIGILGNLYSRLWHGHAATAILPGVFILVPSGLAATGSLISGVQSADAIRQNVSSHHAASSSPGAGLSGTSVFSLGFGMIQVAIGITIGLFISALVVYPYGKRRSGLFSF
ncbi:uncharacterized protein N7477_006353 [Penicillium maclennaniae]|uniref:uncharacterized protein n=1 Tax=Penicillium maclennaniae TaxID=1343394 RepID=UPI002540554A|nr:uncharacterized protein N7477_006353 [Penicillium maclennaniae]KAJ5667783.1 hypothetical protein N7477_006353 [Penicillium maclennaniae]